VLGGHLEGSRLDALSGTVAGYFGYAAQDIRISGLDWHDASAVLAAIGIAPGAPLVGFEPAEARRALEDLDWVERARVHRLFPNQLEISVVERQPFAVWQRDGRFHVIDEAGVTLTGLAAADVPGLPVVTGAGAETAVAHLVNHLEAHPGLSSLVKAGARVGARRWNLYFAGSVKVLLPEHGLEKALAVLSDLHDRHRILDRNVSAIDLRVAGTAVFSPPVESPQPGPVSVAGVSQR
jgi:cell division protein FtsQ